MWIPTYDCWSHPTPLKRHRAARCPKPPPPMDMLDIADIPGPERCLGQNQKMWKQQELVKSWFLQWVVIGKTFQITSNVDPCLSGFVFIVDSSVFFITALVQKGQVLLYRSDKFSWFAYHFQRSPTCTSLPVHPFRKSCFVWDPADVGSSSSGPFPDLQNKCWKLCNKWRTSR